jgi:phage terminase small subunit
MCGNAYEAAVFAGASRAAAAFEGVKLLCSRSVRRKIAQVRSEREECSAEQSLRRIAFGRVNDALKIAFAEEVTPEMIEQADLYNVSEIRRIKGGGIEIKFFDRQKAAEKLIDIENERNGAANAENLISAI